MSINVTKAGLLLTREVYDRIDRAINTIKSGVCTRLDIDKDIKVYAVKNVIRVDIKME